MGGAGLLSGSSIHDITTALSIFCSQYRLYTAAAQVELLEINRIMPRLFLLACRLPSEALPMLQIYTLARLISLLQFRHGDAANYVLNVGNNYVNHITAEDMTMSMAAVPYLPVRPDLSATRVDQRPCPSVTCPGPPSRVDD